MGAGTAQPDHPRGQRRQWEAMQAPEELVRLAEQRAQARAAKDFGEAVTLPGRVAGAR
jgi:hypothetical protein